MTASRTILIEPNRLFRDGLKHLLNGTRFEVSAEFNTVDLALAAAETAETPDLVISGQAVTDEADLRALRQAFPTARIVVLADDLSVDVLREKVFPTNLAAMLLDMTAPSPLNSVRGLSPREQEILQALVTGASNK